MDHRAERQPPPPDEERIVEDPDLTVPTTGSEGPDTTTDEDADPWVEPSDDPEPQEPPD